MHFWKIQGGPPAPFPPPMRGVFSKQRTWLLDPLCHLPNTITLGEIQRLGNRLRISCGPICINPNPKISAILPYLGPSTKFNLSLFFSTFFFGFIDACGFLWLQWKSRKWIKILGFIGCSCLNLIWNEGLSVWWFVERSDGLWVGKFSDELIGI